MSKGSLGIVTWRPVVLSLKFGVALGVGWLILTLALLVLGDTAPLKQVPGSSLDPAEDTQEGESFIIT